MKRKILVVDDDPTSLKTVEGVLNLHGYEVKTASHAQNIESVAKDFNPQLIVMDLMMPEVDGRQAVGRLQKNPVLKKISVIFLTALKTKDEDRGIELDISVGNQTFRTLSKPLDSKLLIETIRQLTGQV